jgi:methyl-accepting chemotaxis protein
LFVNLADLRRRFALPFASLVGAVGAVSIAVAYLCDAHWEAVAAIALVAAAAARLLAWRRPTTIETRWAATVLLMLQVALLVYATHGTTYQPDMHMAFFAALAISACWCCPTTILLSTVFVAVHHLVLNLVYPLWVFPNGADLARVAVHGSILLLEAIALMLLTRSLALMIERSDTAAREAQSALAARQEAEQKQAALAAEVKDTRRQTEDLVLAVVGRAVAAARIGDFTGRYKPEPELGRLAPLVEGLSQMNEIIDRATADMLSVLSTVADGDLTRRVDNRHQGRFEELRQAINHTVERLSDTVSTIQATAVGVGAAATEIDAGANDLSRRTEQQAASLEETAATAEELAASVKASALSSRQAVELSREAMTVAADGGAVVKEAVEAMARIEQASQKISDITGVIDEIAFQTNLLALNAAVEAARAGEAGKGFAVVASEVRMLAQRSSAAAKDIAGLIRASGVEVSQGVKLVRGAGDALENIVEASHKVSATVAEISNAAGEQANGIDGLTQAVADMDGMTQQNAALAEESVGSAKGLTEQIARLAELAAAFRTSAAPAARLRAAGLTAKAAATEPERLRQMAARAFTGANANERAGGRRAAVGGGWTEF